MATVFLSVIAFLSFASCKKEGSRCTRIGEVTGPDYSFCICCGGWFVSYEDETIRFSTVPDENALLEWADRYGYPVPIEFDYTDSEGACADFHKTMTCMKIGKHNDCTLEGRITGYRSEECLCCPGWITMSGGHS